MRIQHALISHCGLLAFGLAAAHADGLSEFQAQVNMCAKAFAARPATEVVYVTAVNSWVKRVYAKAQVRYDVRKTDSLVSPLIGTIEITDAIASLTAMDEQTAATLDPSLAARKRLTFVTRMRFAYQSGRWVFVNATETSRFNDPDAITHSTELKIADLARPGQGTAECLPKS